MVPAYRQRVAQILSARHGGTEDAWRQAHDIAGAWYSDFLNEPRTWSRGTWLEVVNRADAENLLRMFREVGIAPLQDPLAAARALEREVMSTIDSAFPDARPGVARLKRAGHRVYVTTNATESNARGALEGARLLAELDGVFTGERLNAGKATPEYWRGVRDAISVDPSQSVVVDDRLDYLGAARAAEFVTLLLDRAEQYSADAIPSHIRAILRNLAGLPHFVDVLAKDADRGRPPESC
jgi:FMN phosphatase YigB (HAD superfamily)